MFKPFFKSLVAVLMALPTMVFAGTIPAQTANSANCTVNNWNTSAGSYCISQVISFGDSLSDSGNLELDPSIAGRCNDRAAPDTTTCLNTHNPNCGKVWVQYLSDFFGPATVQNKSGVASQAGGTDFAYIGAQVFDNEPVVAYTPPGQFVQGLIPRIDFQIFNDFINGYLGTGNYLANPNNTLYTYWAGANDLKQPLINFWHYHYDNENPAEMPTSAQWDALGNIVLNRTFKQLIVLAAPRSVGGMGAKNIVVVGMPNLSLTPFIVYFKPMFESAAPGSIDMVNSKIQSFNTKLQSDLQILKRTYGVNIYYVDIYNFMNDVNSNPEKYGIKYVAPHDVCPDINVTRPSTDPSDYLFFNIIHPSSVAHYNIALQVFHCGQPGYPYCHVIE